MRKSTNIHNLDSLEREIYRLKLDAKNIEEKIDRNFEHVQENFSSMAMNSLFCKKKTKESEHDHFFGSFMKNEKINSVVNKITDHIADHAAEGINKLLDKIFHTRKSHSNG